MEDSEAKKDDDQLIWVDDGEEIRSFPRSVDPVAALRGSGKGEGLLDCLLRNRRKDRERGS
jgi:hypothetical protein